MSDECTELKNINYQTMLYKKNGNINANQIVCENLDFLLNQEQSLMNINKKWNKLEKSSKLKALYNFANNYDTNLEIKIELKKYLQKCLERKKFKRMRDVEYNVIEGKIKSIPGLLFNKKTKKFIIKKQENKSLKKKSYKRKKSDKRKKTKNDKRKKRNNKTNKIDKHIKEK